MCRAAVNFDKPTTRIRRRGTLTVGVLVAWTIVMTVLALVVDMAMVSYQHRQLRAACDAAALAGTAELMNGEPTFAGPGLGAGSGLGTKTVADVWSAQTLAARRAARFFAAQNRVGGEPLILDENQRNTSDGDIVIGWVADSTSASSFLPWNGAGPCNAMQIHTSRTSERGNPITLWIARKLGITSVDLTMTSQAAVDTRVYGFRPAGHVRVPLLPILVSADNESDGWLQQASSWPVGGVNDRYAVDARTGEIELGADGIPEIMLEIQATDESTPAGNACLLSISGSVNDISDLAERIELGYGEQDMQILGGEFALSENGELWLDNAPALGPRMLSALQSSLLAIQGQKRIWSLGSWDGEQEVVINFAGGRVVDCYNAGLNRLRIWVQPCTLQTSTALLHPDSPANPWLGKLLLTQ